MLMFKVSVMKKLIVMMVANTCDTKLKLFSKIIIMPKVLFAKIKGAICIVTIEAETICNILPRGIDRNGLLLLKLKRKLCYRGHVLFESAALNY